MNTARANEIAAEIIEALPDDDMLARLLSDEGLTVGDAGRTWVAWLRNDSCGTLAVWAGNDIDPGMDSVVEVEIGKQCPYHVHDYATGDMIRRATWAELARSLAAEDEDGGRGVFGLDGVAAYVA